MQPCILGILNTLIPSHNVDCAAIITRRKMGTKRHDTHHNENSFGDKQIKDDSIVGDITNSPASI